MEFCWPEYNFVAVPFSRESSQPRDQTQVSCIAGGFFTNWAHERPGKPQDRLGALKKLRGTSILIPGAFYLTCRLIVLPAFSTYSSLNCYFRSVTSKKTLHINSTHSSNLSTRIISQSFILGKLASQLPRVKLLPLYHPPLTEKITLLPVSQGSFPSHIFSPVFFSTYCFCLVLKTCSNILF